MSNSVYAHPSFAGDASPEQSLTLQQAIICTTQSLNQLSKVIPGYRPRAGQTSLALRVSEVAFQQGILVAQAGTGTGKTFAYLMGVLPHIIYSQKRVIIATHTISLQTQLMEKDLPLFIQAAAPGLRVMIAKGATRYFCPRRAMAWLNKHDNSGQTKLNLAEDGQSVDKQQLSFIEKLLGDFDSQNFNGDLDTLENETIKPVENLVCRQYDRCPGQTKCEFGQDCPFYRARKDLHQAQIVVTNHALLSQTLIEETQTLGQLNDQILIVDEAHQFLSTYRGQQQQTLEFSVQPKLGEKLKQVCECFYKIIKADGHHALPFDSQLIEQSSRSLQSILSEVESQLSSVNQFLFANYRQLRGPAKDNFDNLDQWLMGFEPTQDGLSWLLLQLYTLFCSADSAFNKMVNQMIAPVEKSYSERSKSAQKQIENLTLLSRELDDYLTRSQGCLERFIRHDQLYTIQDRVAAGLVRWISRLGENKGFCAHSNQLVMNESLEKKVYDVFSTTIFTSATIEALNSPQRFLSSLGLDKRSDVSELKVASPFDYSKVSVSAPIKQGDVNHPSFSSKIKQQVELSAQRHKAILVLFSSYQQLNQVYDQCSATLKKQVLRQADFSRQQILDRHKQRVDLGQTSILFGVDSLSEGVDLQRHYLTCVMVAKFPFPNLNEPMLAYEARTLEFLGKNSFYDLSLPICSSKLIQSTGRLIRSEEDFGEVILLDSRIHSKSYAKRLVYSLPFFQ